LQTILQQMLLYHALGGKCPNMGMLLIWAPLDSITYSMCAEKL